MVSASQSSWPCRKAVPRGTPVVPEVNRRVAGSSKPTGA